MNQNNTDVLVLGNKTLLRSDVVAAGGSVEAQIGAKMSAKAAMSYSRVSYKNSTFVDRSHFDWPVSVYYHATPKFDLSAGLTYGLEKPQGGGADGKDFYYNVGARGSFAPKLTGEFSAGFQTRSVASHARERTAAFNGRLNYELTPKTGLALGLARNFSSSALGESLTNSQYSLQVASELNPQWELAASLAYRDVDYGEAVFRTGAALFAGQRRDHFLESSLRATYLISLWLRASAEYTFRDNRSTIPGAEFNGNVFSLLLDLHY